MHQALTKREFYERGGFSNPTLFRKTRRYSWTYWRKRF